MVIETLYKALSKAKNNSNEKPLPFLSLSGSELIDKIIQIDQSPIGRTPRSNPATYTGCFTFIREWYSNLPEANQEVINLVDFHSMLKEEDVKTVKATVF